MTGTFNTFSVSLVNTRAACDIRVVAAQPEIFQKKSVRGQTGLTMVGDLHVSKMR